MLRLVEWTKCSRASYDERDVKVLCTLIERLILAVSELGNICRLYENHASWDAPEQPILHCIA